MTGRLSGRRIALLIEEGFDAPTVLDPMTMLAAEGAEVVLVGPTAITPVHDREHTTALVPTLGAGAARARDFHALIVPAGYAADRMRLRHAMVDLVTHMIEAGKVVAAIGHGPQLLISAEVIKGRTVTCWPSIAVDIAHAGGHYVDRPVVSENGVITARKADDLPPFLAAIIAALA